MIMGVFPCFREAFRLFSDFGKQFVETAGLNGIFGKKFFTKIGIPPCKSQKSVI